jgi:hypothetical protein
MADGKPFLGMGDIMDQQLESADGRMIGRVADIEVEWRKDGSLVLTHLLLGPEALVGRVAEYMRPLAHRLLGGRFERRIPLARSRISPRPSACAAPPRCIASSMVLGAPSGGLPAMFYASFQGAATHDQTVKTKLGQT